MHDKVPIKQAILSHRELRRVCPSWASPVDPFEQHRQLRRRQMHRTARRLRPDKSPTLKTLCEEAEPIAIPPKHLHAITAPTAEDKEPTRKRIYCVASNISQTDFEKQRRDVLSAMVPSIQQRQHFQTERYKIRVTQCYPVAV
jgi:hypothetical protein